jgi:hypothetical protein
MIRNKEATQEELNLLDENESGGQMNVNDGDKFLLNLCVHRGSISSEESDLKSGDTMSMDQPKTPTGVLRRITYSEFVQRLVRCREEEMTQAVNVMRPRPTALNMWDSDDNRRLMQNAVM